MRPSVRIEVVGTPMPKGSMRVVTRGPGGRPLPFARVIRDNPNSKSWASEVARAAAEAMSGRRPFCATALAVQLRFRLVRPQGHFGKGGLRRSAPQYPAVKPDLDKLVRNTADALEGLVFDGDSRIVQLEADKRYCGPGETPGALICVFALPEGL